MVYLKEFRKLITSRLEEKASIKLRKEQILHKVESNCERYELAVKILNAKWMENKRSFTQKLIPRREKIEKIKIETVVMKNKIEMEIVENL